MRPIIIIVGLPGSGKTTLINRMIDQGDWRGYHIFDDLDKRTFPELMAHIRSRAGVIIADPWLCDPLNQEKVPNKLGVSDDQISWIFFENDPQNCILNVQNRHRIEPRSISSEFIRDLSSKYVIPNDATVLPVYKVDQLAV